MNSLTGSAGSPTLRGIPPPLGACEFTCRDGFKYFQESGIPPPLGACEFTRPTGPQPAVLSGIPPPLGACEFTRNFQF